MSQVEKINKRIEELTSLLKDMSVDEKADVIETLRAAIKEVSPFSEMPVSSVRWVPLDKVTPNDYNPNAVAKKEMGLLYISIKHDGYTQPVVTVYDEERDMYVIVDGFHRYFVCKSCPDIYERNHGRLPIVVLEKTISDRMAATVRHNRARGAHSIDGMSNIVFSMLEDGMSDADICNTLGMEAEELLKLKYITGFAKLYADTEYSKAWKTKNMILIERNERNAQNNAP